jgi:hypothetical protein
VPALTRSSGKALARIPLTRVPFVRQLKALLGDVRFLYVAQIGDTTSSVSLDTEAKVITWDATIAGRLTTCKRAAAQSFISASSQYGTTPDAASISFGNGTVDSAFTVLALANVTDTAASRVLISKWNAGTASEWLFVVTAADILTLFLFDQSAGVLPFRASNAVITQGSWRLFGATYSAATGGATAANDITLYQDGAVIASTATNAGTYVAMEDLAAPVEIGSHTLHTTAFLDGSIAMIAVVAGALSSTQMARAAVLCRQFAGVPS